MRLFRKFLLLVGFVSSSVLVTAGATAWSIRQLRTELTEPLQSVDQVLGPLNQLKRDVWRQATLLLIGEYAPPAPDSMDLSLAEREESLDVLRERVLGHVDELGDWDTRLLHSGAASTRLLNENAKRSQALVSAWLHSPGEAEALEASKSLLVVHEIIERIEAKLIEDSRSAVGLSEDLSRTVLLITAVSLAIVGLTIVLSLILFRRWFLVPVDELRVATDRIASGDYTYRIRQLGSDEMGRLASEVNEMAGLVEAAQRERVERERLAAIGEMTRRIVHNLRNPLTGVRGLAELSCRDVEAESRVGKNLVRIIGVVDQFEGWLRSLLDATRPLELQVRDQEIGPVIDRVLAAHQAVASAVDVDLVASVDPALGLCPFDEHHLVQALSALVSNAIEASPRRGRVRVSAGREGHGAWTLAVEDEGEGVSEEALGQVFEPWFTTKPGGTGIGLALVRRVAREHAGSIEVQSVVGGKGARFKIRLPG